MLGRDAGVYKKLINTMSLLGLGLAVATSRVIFTKWSGSPYPFAKGMDANLFRLHLDSSTCVGWVASLGASYPSPTFLVYDTILTAKNCLCSYIG